MGSTGDITTQAAIQDSFLRMNQLFVAKYTSSRNGVEADVIILLQTIEGDLGVLVQNIS